MVMKIIRQLSQQLDSIPVWAQFAIAFGLIVYSCISVYARVNPTFGAKAFSRIAEDEIRHNKVHILRYTIVPLIVTVGYIGLLATKYVS